MDLAASQPHARSEGTSEPFIAGARFVHVGTAFLVAILVLAAARPTSVSWIAAMLVSWLVVRMLGAWCRKRLGGITGEVLGAGSEIVETVVMAMGALMALGS